MQVYSNTIGARASISVPTEILPVNDEIDIKAYNLKGVLLHEFSQVVRTQDGFYVVLPWKLVREDSDFYLRWEFDYLDEGVTETVSKREEVNVATPIIPLDFLVLR